MRIDIRHLRAIRAIDQEGGLANAAAVLNLTQSALSHQIKNLEEMLGLELVLRHSRPAKLSRLGLRLLRLAEQVLPQIESAEAELAQIKAGKTGRLHIAIECHACYDWLFRALKQYRQSWPLIDIDIRPGLSFDAITALRDEEVDLVISSDPVELPEIVFTPLTSYRPTVIAAQMHEFSQKEYITAEDFRGQTLLTYPVPRSKIDVFTTLLTPAGIEPEARREVELTAVILMLAAAGRGVAVLPDWVLAAEAQAHDLITRPLGNPPIEKTLYATTRKADLAHRFMQDFIAIAQKELRS